jgi:uncharacterized protein (DUF1499 family)
MSRWTRFALLFAIVSAVMLLFSGPGTRWEWWHFTVGLKLFALAAPVALAGAIVAAIAWARERADGDPVTGAATALLVSLVVFLIPAVQVWQARRKPPIHDVSSDLDDPPKFEAALALRAGSPNDVTHLDPLSVRLQAAAYPAVRPVVFKIAPAKVFTHALDTAMRLGWTIDSSRPVDGIIEATDTTPWFGFKDDVVIRVRPVRGGTRVDVRSASRVGRGDAGKNAQRIRRYLRALIRG